MITIDSIQRFQDYAKGVLERAFCHAENVKDIILPLAGAVMIYGSKIAVREYNGRPANMIWFEKNGQRFCLLYNHGEEVIELHSRSSKGYLLLKMNNTTTSEAILKMFETL